MGIKLDTENKKGIIITGIIIMTVALLFQFVYFPKSKELKKLGVEYKDVKKDINELYDFIGGQEDLKDNIIESRKDMALLEQVFPSEREVSSIIRQLNEGAKRFKVDVISLKPRDLFPYKDAKGQELKIADYFCKCMPLRLSVESKYQDLGKFLMSLETNRSPMISIGSVMIDREKDIAPKIKAKVDLDIFMLGK